MHMSFRFDGLRHVEIRHLAPHGSQPPHATPSKKELCVPQAYVTLVLQTEDSGNFDL